MEASLRSTRNENDGNYLRVLNNKFEHKRSEYKLEITLRYSAPPELKLIVEGNETHNVVTVLGGYLITSPDGKYEEEANIYIFHYNEELKRITESYWEK